MKEINRIGKGVDNIERKIAEIEEEVTGMEKVRVHHALGVYSRGGVVEMEEEVTGMEKVRVHHALGVYSRGGVVEMEEEVTGMEKVRVHHWGSTVEGVWWRWRRR